MSTCRKRKSNRAWPASSSDARDFEDDSYKDLYPDPPPNPMHCPSGAVFYLDLMEVGKRKQKRRRKQKGKSKKVRPASSSDARDFEEDSYKDLYPDAPPPAKSALDEVIEAIAQNLPKLEKQAHIQSMQRLVASFKPMPSCPSGVVFYLDIMDKHKPKPKEKKYEQQN